MSELDSAPFPPLSVPDRIRAMVGVATCGVILMAGASRLILLPSDPRSCVSVLAARHGWWMILECAVLAVLLGALITWITHAKLEEMGVFGVCVGLALATLRAADFDSARMLWLMEGQAHDDPRRHLALMMTLEAIAWTVVPLAAWWGTLRVIRWLGLSPTPRERLASLLAEKTRGLLTTGVCLVTMLIAVPLLSGGTELTPIRTGQVILAWAGAGYLGTMAGYQLTGARHGAWALFAVGLTAIGGSAYGILHVTPVFEGRTIEHLAQLPSTAFGRALPVEMITVGCAAAIFGLWHHRQLTRFAYLEDAKLRSAGDSR